MEIVQFKNGKYGIRKRSFLDKLFNREGLFRDLNSSNIQWRNPSNYYFAHCQSDSLEEVKREFEMINGCVAKIIE